MQTRCIAMAILFVCPASPHTRALFSKVSHILFLATW